MVGISSTNCEELIYGQCYIFEDTIDYSGKSETESESGADI